MNSDLVIFLPGSGVSPESSDRLPSAPRLPPSAPCPSPSAPVHLRRPPTAAAASRPRTARSALSTSVGSARARRHTETTNRHSYAAALVGGFCWCRVAGGLRAVTATYRDTRLACFLCTQHRPQKAAVVGLITVQCNEPSSHSRRGILARHEVNSLGICVHR